MKALALAVNPLSGTDVRRFSSYASSSSFSEKLQIALRLGSVAHALGVTQCHLMPDHSGMADAIAERLIQLGVAAEIYHMPVGANANDTTAFAAAMRQADCGCLIILGGDGTARAAAKSCGDLPLLPLSTGTNNVYPYLTEGTAAGMAAAMVKEFPETNSCLENDVITVYETVNVGIAVKVEEILVVPVIMDVAHKSLEQIAADTRDAIGNARNRRFEKLYMDGATITVNNLGMFNVEGCLPILNYPETTMLAIGKISKEAWVDENEQIVVRPVSTITALINHAVIDGGHASYILTLLKKIIANPKDYINQEV